MKIELELVIGKSIFMNYWDHMHGNDVCCEIAGDKLIVCDYCEGKGGDLIPAKREITLSEFVSKVVETAKTGEQR